MSMSATRKLLVLNIVLAVTAAVVTWSLRQEPQIPPKLLVDETIEPLKVTFPEKGVSIIEDGEMVTRIHRNDKGVKVAEWQSVREGRCLSVKLWSDEGDLISHSLGAYGTPVWNLSEYNAEDLDFYLLRNEAITMLSDDTEKLYIRGNPMLRDEHLESITQIDGLKTLDIRECSGISRDTIRSLKEKMPATEVLHDKH
ncbi:hypothetical protein OAU50_06050 [Planctomycetota bacterium]|nr:hypothetical protein [Planctomycetota bacterium]